MNKLYLDTPSIFYHTNISPSVGYLFFVGEKKTLFVDSRYYEAATKECFDDVKVELFKGLDDLKKFAVDNKLGTVELNDTAKVSSLLGLKKLLGIHLLARDISNERVIKTEEQINKIEAACKIGDKVYQHVLEYIKPGMTELEVAGEMTKYAMQLGASKMSFDTICASGPNASSPHARPTNRVIKENDWVKLDFGVVYNGWCSDMTRTFIVGFSNNKKMNKIFDIVLKAQKAAVAAAKPGITCAELDEVARKIIVDAGYGDNYGHGLGHGIGIEVHEKPWVNGRTNDVLKPGMVISIEPGIYLPEIGGVRIEDLVAITEDGCKVLTKSDKEKKELGVF